MVRVIIFALFVAVPPPGFSVDGHRKRSTADQLSDGAQVKQSNSCDGGTRAGVAKQLTNRLIEKIPKKDPLEENLRNWENASIKIGPCTLTVSARSSFMITGLSTTTLESMDCLESESKEVVSVNVMTGPIGVSGDDRSHWTFCGMGLHQKEMDVSWRFEHIGISFDLIFESGSINPSKMDNIKTSIGDIEHAKCNFKGLFKFKCPPGATSLLGNLVAGRVESILDIQFKAARDKILNEHFTLPR